MLHLAQFKLQIPRTKRFQIACIRNNTVTSNFFRTSAHSLTQTNSITRNRTARIADDSATHVGVKSKYFDTPRSQNLNFLERNTQSATRRGCTNATPIFYFPSAHLGPIAPSLWPAHVRVSSEYSYIPTQRNADFLERNTRFEVRGRKSTLTSFFSSRARVGQAFLPDNCAYSSAKPAPIRDRIRQARKPDLRMCSLRSSDGHGSLVSEDSTYSRWSFRSRQSDPSTPPSAVVERDQESKSTRPKSTLIGRKST
jgi:hypothetical protein